MFISDSFISFYHGKVSGSLSAFERRFWFRALMACMSSLESENAMMSRFSLKWLGLARGIVIRSRCIIQRSTICEAVFGFVYKLS